MWGQLLLFITSVYCLYLVVARVSSEQNDIKSVLILVISIWIVNQFFNTGDTIQIENTVSEILHVLDISLILTILLIIVRRLRPVIFRYPYFLVYTPLLVPCFFILIIDTYMIKTIILMSIQGIALLVYLLLLTEKDAIAHNNRYGLIAALMIFISFIAYWFLIDLHQIIELIWKITLSAGILVSIITFTKKIEHQHKYMIE